MLSPLVTRVLLFELTLLLFLLLWLPKGVHPHLRELFLLPNEYKEYIHLTQAAKSAYISSVALTGNASAYLSHSSGPWILDSGASDHLSGNKDIFSSLIITSPLPMITLANGS